MLILNNSKIVSNSKKFLIILHASYWAPAYIKEEEEEEEYTLSISNKSNIRSKKVNKNTSYNLFTPFSGIAKSSNTQASGYELNTNSVADLGTLYIRIILYVLASYPHIEFYLTHSHSFYQKTRLGKCTF